MYVIQFSRLAVLSVHKNSFEKNIFKAYKIFLVFRLPGTINSNRGQWRALQNISTLWALQDRDERGFEIEKFAKNNNLL